MAHQHKSGTTPWTTIKLHILLYITDSNILRLPKYLISELTAEINNSRLNIVTL